MTNVFGSVWASEEIGVTDGHTIKNLIAGIWGEEGQRTAPFTLNDISFLDKPGRNPAFSHSRATVGALCQQFDGSFYQPEIGEIGSHGMRRVQNIRSNTLTTQNSPANNRTIDDTAKTVQLTVTDGSYSYWRPDTLGLQPAGTKWFVRAKISCPAGERTIGFRVAAGGGDDAEQVITVNATKQEFTLSFTQSLAGVPEFGLDNRSSVVAGVDTSAGTFTFEDLCIYKARPGQTEMDPEYVSLGVVTAEMLGPELVTNGEFSADSDWSKGANVSIGSGVLSVSSVPSTQAAFQEVSLDAGSVYEVSFDVASGSGIDVAIQLCSDIDGSNGSALTYRNAVGSYTEYIIATAAQTGVRLRFQSGTTAAVDNVSIKRLNYHGWGIDGVRCFATDEYGNDLTVGLGPELWTGGSPSGISNSATGATGSYLNGALVNTTIGSNESYPRFAWANLGIQSGKTYRCLIEIDNPGGLVKVDIRLANSGLTAAIPETITNRLFEGDVAAEYGQLEILTDGRSVWDMPIVSASVREIYPVRAAGAVRNPAITNLCPQSETFDTWTNTVTGTAITPVKSGDLVTLNGGGGSLLGDFSGVSISVPGLTASATYTISVWVKAESAADVGKVLAFRGVGGAGYSLVTLASNWVRASSAEVAISTSAAVQIALRGTTGSSMGEVSFRAKVQVNAGADALPYVPTTTASVALAADASSLDPTAWGYDQDGGVWVVKHTAFNDSGANPNNYHLLRAETNGSNQIRLYNRSGNVGLHVPVAGVDQAPQSVGSWAARVKSIVALRAEENAFQVIADGSAGTKDTSGSLPAVASILVGEQLYSGAIEAVYYFPPATVTDAQLIAMSAGDLPPILELE